MFLILDNLTPEQKSRWNAGLDDLRRVEEEARESDDPWYFHGTSAIAAAWIRRDGFKPTHLLVRPEEAPRDPVRPHGADGVNWGTVNVAQWAAERKGQPDDPPVLLAARLSSLRRAGRLVPDHFAWENSCCHGGSGRPYDACEWPEPWSEEPDWRESVLVTGAFGVVGCARVDGLVLHAPLRDVGVHPDWEARRAERMAGAAWLIRPPRGMVEPTPRTHPPTLTSEEAFDLAYARQWGSPPPRDPVDAGPPAYAP